MFSFITHGDDVETGLTTDANGDLFGATDVTHLPILEPVREFGSIGAPAADAIDPALRVLVELGYDSAVPGSVEWLRPLPTPGFHVPDTAGAPATDHTIGIIGVLDHLHFIT